MPGTEEGAAVAFASAVVEGLRELLGPDLVAAYLIGSLALGDFAPATSDVDIAVVVRSPLPPERKRALADAVLALAPGCPARGLELVVYHAGEQIGPNGEPRFELNLNAGPRMPSRVSDDPSAEDGHWFGLDLSMARETARPLAGPPPDRVLEPVPRRTALALLGDSLAWHGREEPGGANAVLNACRAWRFAEDGVWSSKTDAAEWVLESERAVRAVAAAGVAAARRDAAGAGAAANAPPSAREAADTVPAAIATALAARRGGSETAIEPAAVTALLALVRERVAAAAARDPDVSPPP